MADWSTIIGPMGFLLLVLALLVIIANAVIALFTRPGISLPLVIILSGLVLLIGCLGTVFRYEAAFRTLGQMGSFDAVADPSSLYLQGRLPLLFGGAGWFLSLGVGLAALAVHATRKAMKKRKQELEIEQQSESEQP